MEKPEMQRENKVGPGNPPKETRWKPGQSGNPKGRPKGVKYVSELIKERLLEVPDTVNGKPNKKTWRELVTDSLFRAILKGNHPGYLKELLDRTEGKVSQPIEPQIKADVTFTIGRGYADDKPVI